ncbi:MAG: hypothetical protein K2H33_04825 [Muribaculaceae bacterium]|nr:hypothetical protein [Muribaculaceae bacterium]
MKITRKLLMTMVVMSAAVSGATAQEELSPVTISVDKENGILTANLQSSTWNNAWTSTATKPGLTLTCPANNMAWSGNDIDVRSGAAKSATYTLSSTDNRYYVSAGSFNYSLIGAGPESIVFGSETLEATSAAKTFSFKNEDETANVVFVVNGQNTGVLFSDFTVTLTPKSVQPEAEEPAFITTTITNGEFAPGTNWYTLQIGAAGLHFVYDAGASYMTLDRTTTEFADSDLWCFVGNEDDGYRVYNKAAGPDMMFAAPTEMKGTTGSTSYAIVKAPGDAAYCYEWQFAESTALGKDTPAFWMYEKGEIAKALNNRDSKLAFWSTGKDSGSAVQVVWAEQTVAVTPSTGELWRADGASSAWRSEWRSSQVEGLVFSTTKNNMAASGTDNLQLATGMEFGPWQFTCPEGKYSVAYEFDFVKSGDWGSATGTITGPDGKVYNVTDQTQHFAAGNLDSNGDLSFLVSADPATANKIVLVSNFTVTMRRVTEQALGTIIFRYDGTPGYNVCYRIPSITTIENGANKGRLLAINDYRYSGADIGNGRIDLYMSYSDDNGLTWSAPDHMRNAAGDPVAQGTGLGTVETSLQHPDCGFGDPAMVSDRESGKVLVVSVCGRTPFWSGRRNNPNQVARWYSEDGGDTWTEYSNITEDIYSLFDETVPNGYIDSQFIGSGRMVQSRTIKVGDYYRVYAVMSGYHAASGNVSNWVLYTDDFGQSWHILGDPMKPAVSSAGDEPKAEELPDGSVLLAARRNSGNRHFNIFRYTDHANGEGAWADAVATDMGFGSINACNGEIMILPVRNVETGEQSYMALQSFPYGGERRNVSIAWKLLASPADIDSPSAFTTWNGRVQVSKMGSCYSTMCWQHDNTLGFLYEEETLGKAYCEVYRNFTIEQLTDGAYEYCADADGSVAAALTKALVDYRLEAATSGEPGKYVGQPATAGNAQAEEAAKTYGENPTVENYLLFNKAIIDGGSSDKLITIHHGGVYTLKSAHAYTEFADRWLGTDGNTLVPAAEESDATKFVFVNKEGSDNWIVYNPFTKTFLAQTPAAIETKITVTTDLNAAHEYEAESSLSGLTHLTDVAPGNASFGTIHFGRNNNGHIVIWNKTEQASQWYMSFERDATEDEMPDMAEVSISEVVAEGAEVNYFDVTGRPVAVPVRGQLYITSDRRKLRY